MIKSILVCTDGSENGNTACEYAADLAVKLKAKIAALHVLDSRMLEGPLLADISGWLGAQPFAAQLDQFRTLMESKGEAVIRRDEEVVVRHSFTASESASRVEAIPCARSWEPVAPARQAVAPRKHVDGALSAEAAA